MKNGSFLHRYVTVPEGISLAIDFRHAHAGGKIHLFSDLCPQKSEKKVMPQFGIAKLVYTIRLFNIAMENYHC